MKAWASFTAVTSPSAPRASCAPIRSMTHQVHSPPLFSINGVSNTCIELATKKGEQAPAGWGKKERVLCNKLAFVPGNHGWKQIYNLLCLEQWCWWPLVVPLGRAKKLLEPLQLCCQQVIKVVGPSETPFAHPSILATSVAASSPHTSYPVCKRENLSKCPCVIIVYTRPRESMIQQSIYDTIYIVYTYT